MSEVIPLGTGSPPGSRLARLSGWSDWLGTVASTGCAIHCAAMPFAIASLPSLGLSFLADEVFHQWMSVICLAVALVAFGPGWRRHRRLAPVSVGVVGLALICGAAFGLTDQCCAACQAVARADETSAAALDACCEHCVPRKQQNSSIPASSASLGGVGPAGESTLLASMAPWITPAGGLILVIAHLLNRRLGCCCSCDGAFVSDSQGQRFDSKPAAGY